MSFFTDLLQNFDSIALYDHVKIIGKHDQKGSHGLVKEIKKTDVDEIFVIELSTNGEKIYCQKSNLRKVHLRSE